MKYPLSRARRLPARRRSAALAAALLLALALTIALGATATPTAHASAETLAMAAPPACQTYTPTRHIYDCAGLLTTDEVSALEAKAQAVQ
ncbi:MAG TPA: hypothetical protein VF739_05320, partial [Ktedonobacterales bacterium]